MTFLQMISALGVALLGALIAGIVRKFMVSGLVVRQSEIAALRVISKDALPAVEKGESARNCQIFYLRESLLSYDFRLPILLVSAQELAVLAPFINARPAANGSHDCDLAALAAFKERMIHQGIWPKEAGAR